MSPSLIYSNIHLYRLAMNVLYAGGYMKRFEDVIAQIGEARSVCDLCFGDTLVAEWCRTHSVAWTGIDLNSTFCARARRAGFNVVEGNLLALDLPDADVFVMAGSLYHFHDHLAELLEMVWRHTSRLVVSEPIRNLSSSGGVIGWGARRSANPGDGHARFRYDERTLRRALAEVQGRQNFTVRTISVDRDILLVLQRTPQ
jgi:hypothetical protein